MAGRAAAHSQDDESPLISESFLYKLTAIIVVLALLTAAISIGGRWFGQRMALAGHTQSTEQFSIQIGQDRLGLAANTMRFADQRRSGPAERVDLYVTWPEMKGYSADLRRRFDNVSGPSGLIFLQLSQSTMSRDMSGRLEPIYSKLFEGEPQPYRFGLNLHHLRPNAGYGNEVVLTAAGDNQADYVVRCLLPALGPTQDPALENDPQFRSTPLPGGGDCQRDIHVGQDMTVLYRFSSALLADWKHIDAAVRLFVENRLLEQPGA